MSSLFERFKKLENRAMVLAVRYPLVNPTIEITVNRIPQPIRESVEIAALRTMNEIRYPLDSPSFGKEAWVWEAFHLSSHIVDHATEWKSLVEGEEAPKFSRQELAKMVGEFNVDGKKLFGASYLTAVSEDEKKVMGEENTEQAS